MAAWEACDRNTVGVIPSEVEESACRGFLRRSRPSISESAPECKDWPVPLPVPFLDSPFCLVVPESSLRRQQRHEVFPKGWRNQISDLEGSMLFSRLSLGRQNRRRPQRRVSVRLFLRQHPERGFR